jgi:putative pyoverdin transport system ATP-binding/permease protein
MRASNMPLLSFLYRLRISRIALVLVILASVVGGLSGTALLALIHRALASHESADTKLLLAFVGLCVFAPLVGTVSRILLTRLSEEALYNLRVKLSSQIASTPLRLLEEIGAPRLLTTLTADVTAVADALANLPSFISDALIVAGCLIYLAILSWRPFVFLLGVILFSVIAVRLMRCAGDRIMERLREGVDVLYENFRSLIEGIKELKLHRARRESFLEEEFTKTAKFIRRHKVRVTAIFAVSGGLVNLLLFSTLGIFIFALPGMVNLQAEVITGYVMTTLFLLSPLSSMVGFIPEIAYANVCVKKLGELQLALISERAESHISYEPSPLHTWKSLELIGVTHSYKREGGHDDFVLGPLDLSLLPGELIFITGGNGSGKTTLAKLLAGLYLPESGEIRLNDQSVNDENREYYRQHFTAIFADFYLFKKLLGLNMADLDRQAEFYLKLLQLETKTRVKDGRLLMMNLSQGQRKRLAMLTAILENRPIYLFDEWAADQDQHFREFFYRALLPEFRRRGKTVVVISHDDRFYDVGDRVVKLEYGKLKYDMRVRDNSTKIGGPRIETFNSYQ